ncbi:MAG: DUF1489 domain-containing protein [Alphaproteobacteria bacterium]|nr:DUF1489 domain-containing protein [Alphaproteobacteria bacterium]
MTVNIIKLCVGVEHVSELESWQRQRAEAALKSREPFVLHHLTRNTPRRKDEVLDGGSLYWVIKGLVQVRQRIIAIEPSERENGMPACALVFAPELVETERYPRRAFQGWRYLEADDAPPDLRGGLGERDSLPLALVSELRDLGLL